MSSYYPFDLHQSTGIEFKYEPKKKTIPNRKIKKDKYIKRCVYTCAHCGTGMVARLPAKCPECDKVLTEAA